MKFKTEQHQSRMDKAKMYRMAQYITSQPQLNLVLMAMPDPHNRGVFYELLKPMIHTFEPEYPDVVRDYRSEVVN